MKSYRKLLFGGLVFTASFSYGQFGIKNPQICHDSKRRLVYYNDSTYSIFFAKNKIIGFSSDDSLIKYDEKEKLFRIVNQYNTNKKDSIITIRLMKNYVLISSGNEVLRIDSSKRMIVSQINGFPLQFSFGNKNIEKIQFFVGYKLFVLKIEDWKKKWSWNIAAEADSSLFKVESNPFQHGRIQLLFREDFKLKYGMSISTSFHSAKHVWELKSIYVDTLSIKINGQNVIGEIDLDHPYYYEYNWLGKLKNKSYITKPTICDCKLH